MLPIGSQQTVVANARVAGEETGCNLFFPLLTAVEEEAARPVVSVAEAEGRRRAVGPIPGQCQVQVRSDPTQNQTLLLYFLVAN